MKEDLCCCQSGKPLLLLRQTRGQTAIAAPNKRTENLKLKTVWSDGDRGSFTQQNGELQTVFETSN